MSTIKKTAKPAAAKPLKKRGNMKPAEITPLVIAARKAFDVQDRAGLVEFQGSDAKRFDAWRHQQCMDAVEKPGITSCNHGDFQPLLAHFQTLAGDDDAAFRSLMKTGKPTDHAAPGDTHEARRILVHQIADALAVHHHLSSSDTATLLAEAMEFNRHFHPGTQWKASPARIAFDKMLARKAAIEAKGKGPIGVGYVVYLTRQKTRRPDLTLGNDWQAGLADRCTAHQLTQIRDTVINRIAAVEGTGAAKARNKSQRGRKAAAARSPKILAPRPGTDFQ
ncbi:MAG: hypothetical protein Q8Q59_08315 [Luteolibacter sp.]|jgi:hypothetical protein|nr:hypothetical protein [Luteolibacter sp.]